MSDDSDEEYANPLPPPRREDRGRSGGGSHPLSNDDFRELIKSGSRKAADEQSKNKKNKPRPPHTLDYYDEEDAPAAGKDGEATPAPKKRDWRKYKSKNAEGGVEGGDMPQYRDRAKERREEKNPDYDATQAEMAAMRAVAPPGQEDKGDTYKISIEKSKFLGGDLEHTHLVKGLDYALLQKIRSEMTKENKGDAAAGADGEPKTRPNEKLDIRSAQAKAIYALMFEKKGKRAAVNERFLPGRTSFVFDMEDFASEVPTTVLRSKEDCPPYEELVGVGVDKKVLESLTKIMTYLRLGTTGKALRKLRRKERLLTDEQDDEEDEKEKGAAASDKGRMAKDKDRDAARDAMPPPPPPRRPQDDDDIFEGVGRDYQCPLPPEPPARSNGGASQAREMADAGAAQRGRLQGSYFKQPSDEAVPLPPPEDAYMPPLPPPPPGLPPPLPPNPPLPPEADWAQQGFLPGYPPPPMYMPDAAGWQPPLPPSAPAGYGMGAYAADPSLWAADVAAAAAGLHMPPPPPSAPYGYSGAGGTEDLSGNGGGDLVASKGYEPLTTEEKNQGLGSVFKRDDQRLKQMREKDDREKDPMFVSDSYSECYPGYQNFNTEVMDGSDDEDDLTKMDMGSKAKGHLHRWDFETEEEWSAYNENKEAMPKAAFQFGVKMADGRKTRKTKEQKLNTQYQQITQIWKKKERDGANEANAMAWPEPEHPGKKAKF